MTKTASGLSKSQLGGARQALAKATNLKDVVGIRDLAVAAETYARTALDDEALGEAVDVKLEAQRKAGQVLTKMGQTGERAKSGTPKKSHTPVTLLDLGITKNQSSLWQRQGAMPVAEWRSHKDAAFQRAWRGADRGSSVTYTNQPGIDATKGNVPLAGTAHLYTVSKLLWPGEVEDVLQGLFVGTTLHACCGKSTLGDVRLDMDPAHKPDIEADAADMPVEDGEYETVLCDPPYNGDHGWNHRLLAELARVASKRIIFQHWFIPASPNGRYRKAQEKFALSEIMVWQPKTYFGRAQLVSVFDRV